MKKKIFLAANLFLIQSSVHAMLSATTSTRFLHPKSLHGPNKLFMLHQNKALKRELSNDNASAVSCGVGVLTLGYLMLAQKDLNTVNELMLAAKSVGSVAGAHIIMYWFTPAGMSMRARRLEKKVNTKAFELAKTKVAVQNQDVHNYRVWGILKRSATQQKEVPLNYILKQKNCLLKAAQLYTQALSEDDAKDKKVTETLLRIFELERASGVLSDAAQKEQNESSN